MRAERIDLIVRNQTLATYLSNNADQKFFDRLNVSINTFMKFSCIPNVVTSLINRDILISCCELALKHLGIPSLRTNKFAVMMLGGNAFNKQDHSYDMEFMAYFSEDGEELINYYLPAVLGAVTAISANVDPWCATNILGGYAALSPSYKAIQQHVDYPVLRNYATLNQNSYSVIGGGVFIDLLGLKIFGDDNVIQFNRINKIELIKNNSVELLKTAQCIAARDLEVNYDKNKYLLNSMFCLYLVKNIHLKPFCGQLLSAKTPNELFEFVLDDLRLHQSDTNGIKRYLKEQI